jgi:hypothetical protein
MDQVQPPKPKTVLDGVWPHSRRKQLPSRDYTELSVRQLTDKKVDATTAALTKDAFTRYFGVDASFVGHKPDGGVRPRTSGMHTWRLRDGGATKEAPVRRYRLWL